MSDELNCSGKGGIMRILKIVGLVYLGLSILGLIYKIIITPKFNINYFIVIAISAVLFLLLLNSLLKTKLPVSVASNKQNRPKPQESREVISTILSNSAQQIYSTMRNKRKIKGVSRRKSKNIDILQGFNPSLATIDAYIDIGYEKFIQVDRYLLLVNGSGSNYFFVLYDQAENTPICIEPGMALDEKEYSIKIVLLTGLLSSAIKNDFKIDQTEKAALLVLINAFEYSKEEVNDAKIYAMSEIVREAALDGQISQDEASLMEVFREELDVSEKDGNLLKQAIVSVKLNMLLQEDQISDDQIDHIKQMSHDLDCYDEKMQNIFDDIEIEMFARLCYSGELPIIDANGINLKRNEHAYALMSVKVLQQKTEVQTIRGYAGSRVKIGNVPVYFGGSAPKKIEKEVIKTVGEGKLVVTNTRILLTGTKINYSIWYEKVHELDLYRDAVQINYEGRYGGRFYSVPEPRKLYIMVQSMLDNM